MAHTLINADDIEAQHGVVRRLAEPLGVRQFSVNRLELAPGADGRDHDHAADGEEEVYAVINGSGTLQVDGQDLPLRPGDFVFCSPDTRRLMRAGSDGLVWIGIGLGTGGDSR